MMTFSEFLAREVEAAPFAGGGPSAPGKDGSSTNDFNYGTRELGGFYGLKRKDYLKEPITSFEPLSIPGEPRDQSPVFIDLSDADDDGGGKGTILNTAKDNSRDKMRNQDGSLFRGQLRDKKITLRGRNVKGAKTVDDILLKPFTQMAGGGAGMPPPPGGPGGSGASF